MKKSELKEAAKLFAQKGGRATLKKYGRKHFSKIAKQRWAKSRSRAK